MNYGSIEGKEQNRIGKKPNEESTHQNGTVYSSFTIFTLAASHSTVQRSAWMPGKWRSETATIKQNTNTWSLHSGAQHPVSGRARNRTQCASSTTFSFSLLVYCSCLFSIWHITPLFDRTLEICTGASWTLDTIRMRNTYVRPPIWLLNANEVSVQNAIDECVWKQHIFKSQPKDRLEFCIFGRNIETH